MRNPYEVLGASPTEGIDTIRSKYKALLRKHHPDIAGEESTAYCIELNEAWEWISKNHTAIKGFRWTHGSSVFDIIKKEV